MRRATAANTLSFSSESKNAFLGGIGLWDTRTSPLYQPNGLPLAFRERELAAMLYEGSSAGLAFLDLDQTSTKGQA